MSDNTPVPPTTMASVAGLVDRMLGRVADLEGQVTKLTKQMAALETRGNRPKAPEKKVQAWHLFRKEMFPRARGVDGEKKTIGEISAIISKWWNEVDQEPWRAKAAKANAAAEAEQVAEDAEAEQVAEAAEAESVADSATAE